MRSRGRGDGTSPPPGSQPTVPSQQYYRNICFTSFQGVLNIKRSKTSYGVVQQEIAPGTGRVHWQGYIELTAGMTRVQIQNVVFQDPTVHIEARRGTQEQARAYCMKNETRVPGTVPDEWGELRRQGDRNDLTPLHELATQIANGTTTMKQATEIDPELVCKHYKGLEYIASFKMEEQSRKWRKVTVDVYWGDPGTGKTAYVNQFCKNNNLQLYKQTCELQKVAQWWDKYDPIVHKVIHFDDFCGVQSVPLTQFLQYTDGHQCRVQIKGGFTYLQHTHVFICSNMPPTEWYPNEPDVRQEALMRRISTITEFVAAPDLHASHKPIMHHKKTVTLADIQQVILEAGQSPSPPPVPTVVTVGNSSIPAITSSATRIQGLSASLSVRDRETTEEDNLLYNQLAFEMYNAVQPKNHNEQEEE